MRSVAFVVAYNGMEYERRKIEFLSEIKLKSVIERTIERLRKSNNLDKIVILTSSQKENLPIVNIAQANGIDCFRGKGNNSLLWVLEALKTLQAEIIVLLSGGEPLLDTHILDLSISHLERSGGDLCWVGNIDYFPGFASPIYSKEGFDKIGEYLLGERRGEWERFFYENFKDFFPHLRYDILKPFYFMLLHPNIFKNENIEAPIDPKAKRFWDYSKFVLIAIESYLPLIRELYTQVPEGQLISTTDLINKVEDTFRAHPEWVIPSSGLKINIEVTNNCNMHCIFCPHPKMKREKGYMDFTLFKKIIKEVREFPFDVNIDFTLYGEPLLHPSIIKMIKYADEMGSEINTLYTNGVQLDEVLIKELLNTNIGCIYISLDVVDKEAYREIKGKDMWEKVLHNLKNLLRMKKESNRFFEKYKDQYQNPDVMRPIIALQIIELLENKGKIDEFITKWNMEEKVKEKIRWNERIKEAKDDLNILIPLRYRLKREYKEVFYSEFSPLEHVVLSEFNNFAGRIEDRGLVDYTPMRRFPCRQLQSLSILWDGRVVMCREDYDGEYIVGDASKESLREIWYSSSRLNKLRELHRMSNYTHHPLCSNCKGWYLPVQ
jgi:radical SAM protein with 4Fe4S-binding SPASM domain